MTRKNTSADIERAFRGGPDPSKLGARIAKPKPSDEAFYRATYEENKDLTDDIGERLTIAALRPTSGFIRDLIDD